MAEGMSAAAYGQRLLEHAFHQDTLEARLQRKLIHVFDDENQRKEMVEQAYRNAILDQSVRDE